MSLPSQQKTLFLESKQGAFVLKPNDVPHAGPGEVLVKLEATALNPSDWKVQALGLLVEKFPAVLGFDAAGTIVQLGEGVTSHAIGDRVAVQGWYDTAKQSIHGTFTQYFNLPAKLAAKIPDSIPFDEAATLPSGLATAAFPLYNSEGQVSAKLSAPWVEGGTGKYTGKPFFVCGGATCVGQFAIQFARLSGFSPIITTASLHNATFLKSLGATHVLDRKLPSATLKAKAEKLAEGKPFEVVYDAISEEDTLALGYALTAPGGDFVVVLPTPIEDRDDAITGKRVHMAHGLFGTAENHAVGESLIGALPTLLETGAIKPNRPEVLKGGLEAIPKGAERLKNNQVSGVKLVVRPQESV